MVRWRITQWATGLCLAGLVLGALPTDWAAAPGAVRLHLIVLAAILVPALIVQGAWRGAAALAVVAALSAAAIAPYLRAPPVATGMQVTLVSANLSRTNDDPAGMLRDLLALDADILALQEIPPTFLDDHPSLRLAYPFGHAHFSPIPPGGRAVLSRLPEATNAPPTRGGDQPGHAAASFQIGGAVLRVMSVHFDWPLLGAQAMQIDRFARFGTDFPPGTHAALVGDFNAAAWSMPVARAGAIVGAVPVSGFRGTWRGLAPADLPTGLAALPFGAPLDHILLTPALGVRRIEAVSIAGSDHMALRATLILPAN